MNRKFKKLFKMAVIAICILANAASLNAQDQLTLTFSGRDNNNSYQKMNFIVVKDLTADWQETLNYPDTVFTTEVITDIDENHSDDGVKLYPNPANGRSSLYISSQLPETVIVKVFDIKGSLLSEFDGDVEAGSNRFSIGFAKRQTYIVHVKAGLESTSVKVFNLADGGEDRVSYSGRAETSAEKPSRGSTTNMFHYGDIMEYQGYVINGSNVVLSDKIIKAQYGDEDFILNFDITPASLPVVSTSSVTYITQTTAMCGGNVTNDGGADVTERGICWSIYPNPTINDNHISAGSGIGSFTALIEQLQPYTTYYLRAYAINAVGVCYGNVVSFTTLCNIELPTVTTADITNITYTTATCGGNVTSDGGADVTAKGVCWNTSPNPTVSDSHTTDGFGTGYYTSSLVNLTQNTTYYVRAFATNSVGTAYGEERMFTSLDPYNGHEYVDLGLPSGLLWATCNIGANSPEEYGNYYAWGEVITKEYYSWHNYQWCDGTSNVMTKYCTNSNFGIVDNKDELEPEDDAAHVNWGGNWRMPTYNEIEELLNNCTWEWTTQGSTNGFQVIGPNGNFIFLPAAGYKDNTPNNTNYSGYYAHYWSSSLNVEHYQYNANGLHASPNYFDIYFGYGHYRDCGQTVRPVYAPVKEL